MNACSRNGHLGHTARGVTQVNWPAYGSVGMFEPFTPARKNLASPPQQGEGSTARSSILTTSWQVVEAR